MRYGADRGVPLHIFMDPKGNIVASRAGFMTESALEQEIKASLTKTSG